MEVKPIKISDPKTGETYILEFNRDAVRFAEANKFKLEELTTFPETNIRALWFYAFRKNHPNVARAKTDAMLDEIGGLSTDELARLVELYQAPINALILGDEEDRKNAKWSVSL